MASPEMAATLSFTSRESPGHESEKYYRLNYIPEEGTSVKPMNFAYDHVRGIELRDLRSDDLSIDTHGIELTRVDTQMTYGQFSDKSKVETVYLKEIWELLKKMFKSDDVHIFEYLIRRVDISLLERDLNSPREGSEIHKPAPNVHVDYTSEDIKDRISQLFGGNESSYVGKDLRVLNIWRPLLGPVKDWPMAFCDPNTLDFDKDAVAVDDVGVGAVNEQLGIHYNPAQTWYWVPDQLPHEAVVFMQFDSRRPRFCVPHCAAQVGEDREDSRRESIEVRALVFG